MSKVGEELRRYQQISALFASLGYHQLFRLGSNLIDPGASPTEHRICQLAGQRALARLQMRVSTDGLHHVEGLENYVVVSNHASYLDWALLLGYFPAPLRFVAKRELTLMPFVGGFLRQRGVLIDRGRKKDAKTAIREAVEDEQPWPILLFPEGTRSPDGQLHPFKRGGLRVIADAGATLLPICLFGTYEAFPRHGRAIKTGKDLRMSVLQPVNPANFDDVEATVDAVEDRIRAAHLAGREVSSAGQSKGS